MVCPSLQTKRDDMSDFNSDIVNEFRQNAGKVGGMFEGASLLLLHSTGAKSGQSRVNPLMYQQLDNAYAVFASAAGAPSSPAWYHNIVANPDASIEVGTETLSVTARVLGDDERSPIWEKQKADFANFSEYEGMTTRQIPVVVLQPKD